MSIWPSGTGGVVRGEVARLGQLVYGEWRRVRGIVGGMMCDGKTKKVGGGEELAAGAAVLPVMLPPTVWGSTGALWDRERDPLSFRPLPLYLGVGNGSVPVEEESEIERARRG